MKSQLLYKRRIILSESSFAELVLWQLSKPVRGSRHTFKYSLAYVVDDQCVVRYDNETGKGDHRHFGDEASPISFVNPDVLLTDFWRDIRRWNDENCSS